MSRIFDALQRASLERNAAVEPEAAAFAETFAVPAAGDFPLPEDNGKSLDPALYDWNPSLPSLPILDVASDSIEQFRGLRSQIFQFRDQAPLKSILITSGSPSEGKSFVASNLALSLARNEESRVLLIDADLRSPSLHTILGTPTAPGLTEFLAGQAEVDAILQRNRNPRIIEATGIRAIPNLTFIPAGSSGSHAAELIANRRFDELIATLSPHFDWILIDTPPALIFADAVDLAHAADAVLLVARGGSTPFDIAQRVQAAFSNSRILGFVLNAVKDAPNDTSYYYGNKEPHKKFFWRKDKRKQS